MAARRNMLSDCFEEGVEARAAGCAHCDNPYSLGSAEHDEWSEGWNAVCDLDEDHDPASTRADTDD